ncbi:hypothetical protein F5Y19DRAFT_475810 [Xylariaceae sp. FL1651]|nr:hypothetical protein F5Y19DRAFT_475810 [Xylariaceae sp. FL1651]
MRFTSFIVAGLCAVAASAQSSTDSAPAATATSASASASASVSSVEMTGSATTDAVSSTVVSSSAPAQTTSAVEMCLAACDPSDTKCRANCIAVPSPDNQNVNQTTSCVAACPQGNGTAADNQAYADCVNGCIGQYYFTSTGTPNPSTSGNAGSSNSGSATPSVTQVETTITTHGSTLVTSVPSTVAGSHTASGDSPASTSSSHGAAAVYGPVGSGLGLLGVFAGFLAL